MTLTPFDGLLFLWWNLALGSYFKWFLYWLFFSLYIACIWIVHRIPVSFSSLKPWLKPTWEGKGLHTLWYSIQVKSKGTWNRNQVRVTWLTVYLDYLLYDICILVPPTLIRNLENIPQTFPPTLLMVSVPQLGVISPKKYCYVIPTKTNNHNWIPLKLNT